MAGVTPKTRWIVIGRDSDEHDNPVCQWCGTGVRIPGDYSLQHRRARGMGGTKLSDANRPQNLVTVHGSGTTGCHSEIESNLDHARERGFRIYQTQNPLTVPLIDWAGESWWLTADGRKVPVGPEPVF